MNFGIFFTGLGYLIGGVVFYHAARRRGMATEGMGYVLLIGLLGGVIGAKLTEWVIATPFNLVDHFKVFLNPYSGGRTIMAGIFFGWISVLLAKWWLGIRRSTGDLFALALPAGEAVGRIGCFFNTCCYGIPTHVSWGVYQHGAWRHPTQLYSSGVAAIIFFVLLSLRKKVTREGDLFKLYLVFYSIGRFVMEFLRERAVFFVGLSFAQWVCLETLFFLTIFFLCRQTKSFSLSRKVA